MTTIPTRTRLTKRAVEALPTPTKEQGERVVWDADLVGFGLRAAAIRLPNVRPAEADQGRTLDPPQDRRASAT